MAVNYSRRKYAMRERGRKRKIDEPTGFKPATNGFGKPATQFLKLLQKDAGLRPTGNWTQATQDLFFPPKFGPLAARIAKAEIGVKEHPAGSNDGERVRVYQSTTGAYKAPWCASGARWVYGQAAKRAGEKINWFSNPAYVPNWTKAAGGKVFKAVSFNDAKAGDYVTLWDSGHIEIVIRREGEYLICVGFNTSPVGKNANGGMVAQTKRHRSEVTKIGRLR
jgi:hypothetical protein